MKGKGFEWQADYSSEDVNITYDVDALKQILMTLIENGLKFSEHHSQKSIQMRFFTKDSKAIWQIRDKGPGVPKKHLNKIFTQFYRAENELTRKTTGTGIGLAMVKMFMDGMGGSVEAKNIDSGGLEINLIFNL